MQVLNILIALCASWTIQASKVERGTIASVHSTFGMGKTHRVYPGLPFRPVDEKAAWPKKLAETSDTQHLEPLLQLGVPNPRIGSHLLKLFKQIFSDGESI